MDLKELKDRLAKATGPDRELDTAICEAFGMMQRQWISGAYTPLRVTASIDAAVTLVQGMRWVTGPLPLERGGANASIWLDGPQPHGCFNQKAATPALALCLARLEYELAKEGKP